MLIFGTTRAGCRPPADRGECLPDVRHRRRPRVGARVQLLDANDRVLLVHVCNPQDHGYDWRELPAGGTYEGEKPEDGARREVAEETGLVLPALDASCGSGSPASTTRAAIITASATFSSVASRTRRRR